MELYISIVVVGIVAVFFFIKNKQKPQQEKIELRASKEEQVKETISEISWTERLNTGLKKSRDELWGRVGQLFSQENPALDEIEELLYTADLPTRLVDELIEKLSKSHKGKSAQEIQKNIFDYFFTKLEPIQASRMNEVFQFQAGQKTKVIMIVGVNGAGKTTTIGKLATKLKSQGAKVLVGACDTFRAAAVDQLQVWCDRAGVEMVRAADGADPSGVAYGAVQRAHLEKFDFCLIDTAGRLHTNQNLMEELAKTKRVLSKISPDYPQEVLLVVDAITGQNAIKQAQEFNKSLQLSGIIFTKCDGSSKAGSAIAIIDELKVPVTNIGVGEAVEDLEAFDLSAYLRSLLGIA